MKRPLIRLVEVAPRDGLQAVKGRVLPTGKKVELVRRLKSVPSVKAARAMRQALTGDVGAAEQLSAITEVLDRFGIQQAEKVEPLSSIRLDEVRLVAWMAVQGSRSATTKEIDS